MLKTVKQKQFVFQLSLVMSQNAQSLLFKCSNAQTRMKFSDIFGLMRYPGVYKIKNEIMFIAGAGLRFEIRGYSDKVGSFKQIFVQPIFFNYLENIVHKNIIIL